MADTIVTHKHCPGCKTEKPAAEFHRNKATKTGLNGYCKPCSYARSRAYLQTPRGRAKKREYQARYDKRKGPARYEYLKRHRQTPEGWISYRRAQIKHVHGITLETYDEMLAAQGGGCAICGQDNQDGKSLHVDHDHATGKIRGLLCSKHNTGLGMFADDTELLRRAIAYLEANR